MRRGKIIRTLGIYHLSKFGKLHALIFRDVTLASWADNVLTGLKYLPDQTCWIHVYYRIE